jgi:hypothetical protein
VASIAIVALFVQRRIGVTITAGRTGFGSIGISIASVAWDERSRTPITTWGERSRTPIATLAVASCASHRSRLIGLWACSSQRGVASRIRNARSLLELQKIARLAGMTRRDQTAGN